MTRLLPEWLARQATTRGDRLAMIVDEQRVTWRDLDALVARSAGALLNAGVSPGERVGLLARPNLAAIVAVFAVARAGAVLVPLNSRLTARELVWPIENSGLSRLLHDDHFADLTRDAAAPADGVPLTALAADGMPDDGPGRMVAGDTVDLDATQGIIYTSGTTGQAKGVTLTFGNWWWSAVGAALHLGARADDHWLASLPLFHVGGLSILFRSVIGGLSFEVQPRFDPARMNKSLDRGEITHVSVVATMLTRLLEERNGQPFPPGLRLLMLGGGPAPVALVERALALGLPVAPTYGLTETTSQATTLPPGECAVHPGSAGSALPVTRVRIEREGVIVGPEETGEIAVSGPTVTRGYWNQAPIAAGAWFRTGDIGRLDEAGYLTVLDRRDDLIVSGGENVSPMEVERVLLEHPAVAEAGVIGIPDARWGAAPVAFVVLRSGSEIATEELFAWTADRLGSFKRPKRIVAVDALPRNASGKLLRRVLREQIGAGRGQ